MREKHIKFRKLQRVSYSTTSLFLLFGQTRICHVFFEQKEWEMSLIEEITFAEAYIALLQSRPTIYTTRWVDSMVNCEVTEASSIFFLQSYPDSYTANHWQQSMEKHLSIKAL